MKLLVVWNSKNVLQITLKIRVIFFGKKYNIHVKSEENVLKLM